MARGKPCRGSSAAADGSDSLDGRKTMASLFASGRQNFAAPCSLHARAKTVCLVATAHFRLKRAFRQRALSLIPGNWPESKRLVKSKPCRPAKIFAQQAHA